MTPRFRMTRAAVLALSVLALCAVPGWAGDSKVQFTAGANVFQVSPPCPVKQFPTFESIVPVPAIVDPFEVDFIPIFCQIEVFREGKGVKGVKGRFESEVIVRDSDDNDLDAFPVGRGVWRTNKQGRASFDFDLPAEIFADGFESGDTSAWSYTRTDPTNKKRADQVQVQCGTSTSRSQQTTWVTDDR